MSTQQATLMSTFNPQQTISQPPKKQFYFVNRDSFVKEDTDIDVGYYIHKQKLGEGGFSKVRLGTHLLTGEKVAIKCMEKEKLGEDLFRVQTEINALKVLQHENISKLLQVIETDTMIYLILEYCSGGELFDYIVAKSRLSEPESQRIMSSLIEVLAFIHSLGYSHRDLKPENILFDSKHRIKLIDFGLAGQAKDNQVLKTCCGSFSYASPELLAGSAYNGPLADVWSAGVILYTLLVGKLPFEDDNLTQLYKKIQSGIYVMPSWLSRDARSMISSMLQVNPKNRSNIQQLLKHPWINAYRSSEFVEVQRGQIDEELLWQVHKYFQTTQYGELRKNILTKFGYQTATYWLLKEKNKNLLSPLKYRNERVNFTQKPNPVEYDKVKQTTPTKVRQTPTKQQPTTPNTKTTPVAFRAKSPIKPKMHSPRFNNSPVKKTTNVQTPLQQQAVNKAVKRKIETNEDSPKPAQITKNTLEKFEVKCSPAKQKSPIKQLQNKENSTDSESPSSRIPIAVKSPIMSPLRNSNQYSPLPTKKARMFSPDSKIPVRNEIEEYQTPIKNKLLPLQTPKRSLLKRILATATPGHNSLNMPRSLTTADSTKNLTMTRYNDPQQCIDKLIEGLRIKGVECKQKGFTIRCAMNNKFANVLTFNLEVCQFNGSIAIQRKRLRGDAWNYKKICEEILRISNESDSSATTKQLLTTDI